jgi:hypothetical protein
MQIASKKNNKDILLKKKIEKPAKLIPIKLYEVSSWFLI